MTSPATLVLYDADCGICVALAGALSRRDVAVASLGSAVADACLRDLTPLDRSRTFHAVDAEGRRRSGGEAVPLVLRALGRDGTARVAAALPGVTELGYRALARSRRVVSLLLGLRACPAPDARRPAQP